MKSGDADMRTHALLLYNPTAGRGRARMWSGRVAERLRREFAEVTVEATEGVGSAAEQVRRALHAGVTHVFVMGGDGTVADALQAMVAGDGVLAVLPLGTGNVVAQDLGLAKHPLRALEQLLGGAEVVLPVGVARGAVAERYFLAAAGAGLLAELMRQHRGGAGRMEYYVRGLRLVSRGPKKVLGVRIVRSKEVVFAGACVELLVSRVGSYGGALRRWKTGAGMFATEFVATVATEFRRTDVLRFLLRAVMGRDVSSIGPIRSVRCDRVECWPADPAADVPAQLDGTGFGVLPLVMVSDGGTVRMMVPGDFRRASE